MLEVNYEDIVSDPAAESRRLIEFVGLPWDDQVLRFTKVRRRRRPPARFKFVAPSTLRPLESGDTIGNDSSLCAHGLHARIPEAELA